MVETCGYFASFMIGGNLISKLVFAEDMILENSAVGLVNKKIKT